MTLGQLADRIVQVDETLRQQAAHAVNCMLTARNWFIGLYIVEFEQHGADRAQYGEQLLKTLAKRINRKGMTWRRLYEYRTFYNVYPQLQSEILGCWTTRELDRQISSLYYESFPSTQLGVNSRLRINFYHNGIHIYPQAC